jgi:hypothetical protein
MMAMPGRDKTIVRDLAKRVVEIASLPVHKEKAEMWRRLNRLDPVRPMVMLQNGAWNETLDDREAQCTDPFCREKELSLRRLIYQWEHMPGDMVVENVFYIPIVTRDTGWGLEVNAVRPDHYFGAAHFEPSLRSEEDIDRLQVPRVSVDAEETERLYQRHCDLYEGVLEVRKRGRCGFWFSIFDLFIQWRGLDQAFTDMVDRPAWVHRVLERMTEGMLAQLETLEQHSALGLNNGNVGVGPGGLGFTDELPQGDFDGTNVRARDLWGHATTQIFAVVSPAMHEEFALQYESRYLERFGLAGYGCCEPLHHKVDIIRKHIPNLRRISMSPWVDVEAGAAAVGKSAVFSYKPNPALLGGETWDPDAVRAGLREVCEKTRGCAIEIIMKDLHTCRNQPQRMWDWVRIASELAEEFAC